MKVTSWCLVKGLHTKDIDGICDHGSVYGNEVIESESGVKYKLEVKLKRLTHKQELSIINKEIRDIKKTGIGINDLDVLGKNKKKLQALIRAGK